MGRMGVLTDGGMLSSGSIQLVVSSAGLVWLCDVLPARCCSWLWAAERARNCLLFSTSSCCSASRSSAERYARGIGGAVRLVAPYGVWRGLIVVLVMRLSCSIQMCRPSEVGRSRFHARGWKGCRPLPAECALSALGFPGGHRPEVI